MATPSLRSTLLLFLSPLLLSAIASAATVTYDFDIGWVTASPDGAYNRPTIGINGKWPCPAIHAAVGDRVIVNVVNSLGNESTSLHFHGLYMNGTAHMDGPVGVTQCAIMPGSSFTYDFTIDQPGTYWYHSHSKGQYPDGLRGPLIVTDPAAPFAYDDEVVLTLSDWYHGQMAELIPQFMSKTNPTGAEPVPDSALMNDVSKGLQVPVQPSRTYLFRVVNMGAFASQYVWFEGHDELEIVELDGVYTVPHKAAMIYLSAGQRCSFLLRTRAEATDNFAIVGSMDTTLFDSMPEGLQYNVTGHLVYAASQPLPPATPIAAFTPVDDTTLTPYDGMPLLPAPTRPEHTIHLTVKMDNLGDGRNYAFFNNITYAPPRVPTLYTLLSAPASLARDPRIYGQHTNPFVLEQGQVVQIVLKNDDDGRHPFHLHGHSFQVLYRSKEDEDEEDDGAGAGASVMKESDYPPVPMRRDTVVVWGGGEVVLRFRADNPGIWLFHCHIEWHVDSGLIATLVESPLELRSQLGGNSKTNTHTRNKIPLDHYAACAASRTPAEGNAAGNSDDFLDLRGENAPPRPLPEGFTAKGYVALLVSTLSGLVGLFTIAWYGLAPVVESPSRDDEGRAGGSGGGGDAAGRASEDSVASMDTVEAEAEAEQQPLLQSSEDGNGSGGGVRRISRAAGGGAGGD
ncbi:iron transport multicopper oxidase [Microdochium nivale]|nr:iron transport multicopper oxidase [Microdochium nivale]